MKRVIFLAKEVRSVKDRWRRRKRRETASLLLPLPRGGRGRGRGWERCSAQLLRAARRCQPNAATPIASNAQLEGYGTVALKLAMEAI